MELGHERAQTFKNQTLHEDNKIQKANNTFLSITLLILVSCRFKSSFNLIEHLNNVSPN